MTKNNKVVIGTRKSKLALWQAEWVKSEIEKMTPGLKVELNKITTTGDKILDVPLAKVGGKGLFVKEIEEALLRSEADIAVHSMKDVPTDFPKGLHLAVICKREDPRDAFITRTQNTEHRTQTIKRFKYLPKGAAIGTSSLRRMCQLLNIRPDLKIMHLRGNLDTRLRKLDEGQFDAVILAAAGVKRLGWAERITELLEPEISLPAIGQGAIGIECRIDDKFTNKLIEPLNHPETAVCVRAERAFLKKLEGGCQVPIAAYARLISQKSEVRSQKSESQHNSSLVTHHSLLIMDGLVGNLSGDTLIKGSIKGSPDDAEKLGIKLAEELFSRGAGEILAEIYKK
ncbi:MAG: hydroxymethylbilane synthase [Thermodesulfovibrionia bacterium]|nr:hydroxymethylbilane synthase [Thermodesulfovibrionia bacterium]